MKLDILGVSALFLLSFPALANAPLDTKQLYRVTLKVEAPNTAEFIANKEIQDHGQQNIPFGSDHVLLFAKTFKKNTDSTGVALLNVPAVGRWFSDSICAKMNGPQYCFIPPATAISQFERTGAPVEVPENLMFYRNGNTKLTAADVPLECKVSLKNLVDTQGSEATEEQDWEYDCRLKQGLRDSR